MNISKKSYLYASCILAFIIDVCAFFFFGKQLLHTQMYPIISNLFSVFDPLMLAVQTTLLLVASFLFNGAFMYPIIFLVPMVGLACAARRFLYTSWLYPPAVLLISILIHQLVIEHLLLGISPALNYTIMKISVNIMMYWIFSLTVMFHGASDDRSSI